jgi:hypothetical protein
MRSIIITSLTALAIACGGSDSHDDGSGDDNSSTTTTREQAAKAFPLFAEAMQTAFVEGQNHQTPAATGFTFAVSDTSCAQDGTYAISGTGVLADADNPGSGGSYQFATTFTQCTTQTYALDGDATETASISQTIVSGTITAVEHIHVTSEQLGFAIPQTPDMFTCGETDLTLQVTVTQSSGQAPVQTVTGSGTWCTFPWDNSFVGDYLFSPQPEG